MYKLFLTGGTGFFGKALLKYWLCNNPFTEIHIISRDPQSFIQKNKNLINLLPLIFHEGNIKEPNSFPDISGITHIIHAATDSTLGPNLSQDEIYNQIVNGTINTLDFAVKKSIPNFFMTSSGGVYGSASNSVNKTFNGFLETDKLNGRGVYSESKIISEKIIFEYKEKYKINAVIARCFSFVGEDLPLNVHFAIGNFIKNALENKTIIVNGDGLPIRSYLYQADLARIITKLTLNKKQKNIFNVGSDQSISIKNLAYLIKDIVNPKLSVKILGIKDKNIKDSYYPNISRLKEEFPSEVFLNTKEAIIKTIDNLKI